MDSKEVLTLPSKELLTLPGKKVLDISSGTVLKRKPASGVVSRHITIDVLPVRVWVTLCFRHWLCDPYAGKVKPVRDLAVQIDAEAHFIVDHVSGFVIAGSQHRHDINALLSR
jgi:hypothetical protein